jgi:hypothetical protein
VRHHLSRSAVCRRAKPAGQRQRLQSQTGLIPTSLDLGNHTAGRVFSVRKAMTADASMPRDYSCQRQTMFLSIIDVGACGNDHRKRLTLPRPSVFQ